MSEIDIEAVGESRLAAGTVLGPYDVVRGEFIWVVAGHAELETGGRLWDLRPGTAVISLPGDRNRYAWDRQRETRLGWMVFHGAPAGIVPSVRTMEPGEVTLPLLDHLLWLDVNRPSRWRESLRTVAGYALEAVVTGAAGTERHVRLLVSRPIVQAMEHVKEMWNRDPFCPVPLRAMAGAANVGTEHLCRVFAREIGIGPAQTLRCVRVYRAAILLSTTGMTVGAIAAGTGFADQFHFSRVFKQITGSSPSRFRQDGLARVELPDGVRQLAQYLL